MIALISARGGSQRVPRKNLVDFCGHPLVAWSIVQAKCSHRISRVVVTTDDDEIAQVCHDYGADIVIRRPVWDNGVTVGKAFLHACQSLIEMGVDLGERMVQLLPTSPVRKPEDIDGMIEEALRVDALHMWPIVPLKEMVVYKNEASWSNRFGTETLGKCWHMQTVLFDKFWNYSVFGSGSNISKVDWLLRSWQESPMMDFELDKPLSEGTIKQEPEFWGYKVEQWQAYEIDYPEDVLMCELMMNNFILKGNGMDVYKEYKQNG